MAGHGTDGGAGDRRFPHALTSIRVIIVDDNEALRDLVCAWLARTHDIEVVAAAGNGIEAVEAAREHRPDVVLMDVDMPAMSGPEATERLLAVSPSTRVIAYTGFVDAEPVTQMIVAGARGYAVKGTDPVSLERAIRDAARGRLSVDDAALTGLFEGMVQLARRERERRLERERLNRELQVSYRETITALAKALDMRDDATQDHVERVARHAVEVGRRLGLTGKALVDLEYGAIFHDVGKIGVPDDILKSSSRLTDEQWRIVRMHTIWGERIVGSVRFLRDVARIVRHSHEKWDGTGYPDGLRGEQIPLASRIVHACDAFDVMTGGRRYQRALTRSVALARLRRAAGTCFDPRVVAVLCDLVERQPAGERPGAPAAGQAATPGPQVTA